jgi:hypothetical protein
LIEAVLKVGGTLLAIGATVFVLTALDGWDEFLDVTGLGEAVTPVSVDEVRAEEQINDLHEDLNDEDWEAACERLTPQAVLQLMEIVVGRDLPPGIVERAGGCATVFEQTAESSSNGLPQLDFVEVTGSERSRGALMVDSDQGQWRMDRDYRVTRFPDD